MKHNEISWLEDCISSIQSEIDERKAQINKIRSEIRQINQKRGAELVLDCAIWRSGSDGADHGVGEGTTALLNGEGYMCCLGQFSEQIGVSKADLLDKSMPEECDCFGLFDSKGFRELFSGDLPNKLSSINDTSNIAASRKIELIRDLLDERGITLKVINQEQIE